MAIIKCKMCGGDLNIVEDATVCECEYCGTRQTVPKADDEKKLTLFARASRLLRACEFDKASGVFETIVADFPDEAEAYWGLVLCKYGIEYVDDPATGKKIPTCHRSSFDSVMKDANFEQACENTDAVARRVYRDEARAIEELRKGIIEVSDKEEPYDVFISYKEKDASGERTVDSVIAQEIYRELTRENYRVFFSRISLENRLGSEYEPYIFAALNSAKVMIVVGTDYENFDAVWVKNEWSRFLKLIASGKRKTLIPVFRDMDAYDMPEEFNKLTALDMGKVGAMQDLVHGVEKILGKRKTEKVQSQLQQPAFVSNEADAKTAAAVKRGRLALEECNWQRATEHFEQALSLDAECAEAYFGMALAEAQCRNAEEYAQNAINQTPVQKILSLSHDEEHICSMVDQYSIPRYLDASEIRRYYIDFFDLSYITTVDGQKSLLKEARQDFESNRNVALAYRFAKGPYRDTLENFKHDLFEALEDKVRKAEQKERESSRQKEKDYAAYLKRTDEHIEELNKKKQVEQEEDYQDACKLFYDAKSYDQYSTVKEKFLLLGDYKEALDYVEKADLKLKQKEKEKQKKYSFVGIIIGAITVLAIAGILFVTKVIIPNKNYKAAEALFDAGQYEEAITAFEALGKYKDSDVRIEEANEAILALKYAAAEELMKADKFEEAIAAFNELNGYSHSAEKIEEAKAALLEEGYSSAEAMENERKFDVAAVAFKALGEYKDSADRALECKYKHAIAVAEKGEYERAINVLKALGEYKDSVTKIEEIEILIQDNKYTSAEELLKTGKYEDAIAAFKMLGDYRNSEECLAESYREMLKKANIGETISFGNYEQDNDRSNGDEGVEWIVLAKDIDKTLVISKYGLDCKQFNTSFSYEVTWETSSLRRWLNGEFKNIAFSAVENALILTVKVSADANSNKFGVSAGKSTKDKIFILSEFEAKKYFLSNEERECESTKYANAMGCRKSWKGNCEWWLRTPGETSGWVIGVDDDGEIGISGTSVTQDNWAVRPAMWLDIES